MKEKETQLIHISSFNIELLKWIAIIGMIVDHSIKLFNHQFIYIPFLYELGRISFPLFAIILVYNYMYNTSSKEKYLKRLLIFAFVSQPFFMFAFHTFYLNIFFVLFAGLLSIYLFEKSLDFLDNQAKQHSLFILSCSVILILSPFVDYQPFGILLIVSLYFYFQKDNLVTWGFFNLLILLSNHVMFQFELGLIGLGLAIILLNIVFHLVLTNKSIVIPRMNKWFFYLFYPLHLLTIMALVKLI